VIEEILDAPFYQDTFTVADSQLLAQKIIERLPDAQKEIELTHVQVFLSELWERASEGQDGLPQLDDNGKILKMPVIYGNSERWKGARRDGIFRDNKGKVQLPLLMIRRTSISKDESMPMLKRHVSYQGITKYSKDNRYDRFNLLGKSVTPKYEIYKIQMPEYVEVNYECMGWTSYTEQLNMVVESLNYASTYWGDKDRFKFRTEVSDYNIVNEVGEGTERINRVEFSLTVKAYLLPEKFDGQNTTKKSFNSKKIIVATETDVTANGRLEGMLTTPSPYYDNKDLIDFLSLNNSKSQNPVSNNTITFSGIKLIKTPPSLTSVVTNGITITGNVYDIKLYINGVRYYESTHFRITSYVMATGALTISFDTPYNPGFTVDSGDEVVIIGKFIDV
jgi:hypothetical protein